MESQQL
ncbi:hypothetical protein SuUB81_20440, partial [Streptococcus uberis]